MKPTNNENTCAVFVFLRRTATNATAALSFHSSVPGHSGQGAPPEQEAGVALPLQEEVGLCGGSGAHRGGEVGAGGGGGGGGAAAARSACLQTQEVLPLATPAAALASWFITDGNHHAQLSIELVSG